MSYCHMCRESVTCLLREKDTENLKRLGPQDLKAPNEIHLLPRIVARWNNAPRRLETGLSSSM